MKYIKPLVLTAAVGLLSSMSARAADTAEKYTYVIVHVNRPVGAVGK